MRKYLIALTMLAILGTACPMAAQSPQTKEEQELVDSTSQDAFEAYSDTTATNDSTVVSQQHRLGGPHNIHVGGSSLLNDIFRNAGLEGMMGMGMTFVLLVLIIIFVIAPVVVMTVLFFFIYKNRKQKMKMAEMAMKQGQPIPDQLLAEHKETDEELRQKGIRQTFLGVGLLAFFGYLGSNIGIGIGILVTVIGLGKLVIVKTNKN